MAETLGSLCDKLTIIKLKQWHSEDSKQQKSLKEQEIQLISEIDVFIANSVSGKIPVDRLIFSANKVYKKDGNIISEIKGSIGEVFSKLSTVNCELWHEQEKVYDFSKIAPDQKDAVVKRLAILNLERNKCMDQINEQFMKSIKNIKKQ